MVKLDREMYQEASRLGMTVTELMEDIAPSKVEGLDAFEHALMTRRINLKTATVERFYASTGDSYLFPEFINRNIRIGLTQSSRRDVIPEDLIATTTIIDGARYQAIRAEFDEKEVEFKRVGERAEFPTVTIDKDNNLVHLVKFGVTLNAPYEVLRRMKLPLLAAHIQLLGRQMRRQMVAWCVSVLINGDGNDNAATTISRTMEYGALVEFLLAMSPWEPTIWFAKKDLIETLLLLPELQDAANYSGPELGVARILGNPLKAFNWSETDLGDNLLFQVDKTAALESVKEVGAELVESGKIIDRQTENTVISSVFGLARIFENAAVIFEQQAAPQG